jgi:hypothetical protein
MANGSRGPGGVTMRVTGGSGCWWCWRIGLRHRGAASEPVVRVERVERVERVVPVNL